MDIFASLSLSTIDHRWLIIAFAVFVAALVIFTQERSRAAMMLIGFYAVVFVLSFIPAAVARYEKAVPERDRFVIRIVIGTLPIAALFARKRRR